MQEQENLEKKSNENFKLKQKEYYQQNKEKIDNRNKIYAITNKEQINAQRIKRNKKLKLSKLKENK